jgi:hypothetical protein
MGRSKKKNTWSKALFRKRLLVLFSLLVLIALTGFVGWKLYPPFRSLADSSVRPNPPFAYTCGFNVMFQIDNSTSRSSELVNLDKEHIKAFINAFNGTDTHFLLSLSGPGVMVPYTSDKSKVVDFLDRSPGGDGGAVVIGGSDDIDLNVLTEHASYRPSKQTIVMIFTDGGDPNKYDTEYAEPSNQLKASGARIIAFVLPGGKVDLNEVRKITGPNIDTGNILTTDVVHNGDYASLTSQLSRFVGIDSCNPPPPAPTPSGPGGPSGPGPGIGNGDGGTGTGTNGQGAGGGGGGGASATTEADKPNPLPSTASQGDTTEQPEVDPSPFFDGKLFAAGSDSDGSISKDKTVEIGGLRIGYGWFYLLGLVVVIAGSLATYSFWWRGLAPAEQLRLRRRLLLKR